MAQILTEVTPLTDRDFFYLAARKKEHFNYPIHKHHEFELNFVAHCNGAVRTVGDSVERLTGYDLVLVGSDLEHVWETAACDGTQLAEITIQFMPEAFGEMLDKHTFDSVRDLFERAQRGVAFELPAIMQVYSLLDEITKMQPGFMRMLRFLEILYKLSVTEDYHLLSSAESTGTTDSADARRIQLVKDYIAKNYTREIRLQQLSDLAEMTPATFSRFFRRQTSCNVSDYLIFTRLGYASRLLVDSKMSVVDICFACGFNNLSNFNRIFKKRKGCTPKEFRDEYLKKKVLV